MLEIGNFFISDDIDFAWGTFNSLLGKEYNAETSILRIDLAKKTSDRTEYLRSIGCTLDEYVENCRIITRDAFKFFSLER